MMSRVVFAMVAMLACACAIRGGPLRGYDKIDDLQCAGDRQGLGGVSVFVQDQAGAAMPGLHVYLLNADTHGAPVPSPATAITDEAGVARLRVEGGRYYSLVVAFVGFVPEVRLLLVEAGCSGNVRITLKVLALDGLQVQQAGAR